MALNVSHPRAALALAVEDLEGVGPSRAKAFRALGVFTLGDLLEYFPRDYQTESSELTIDRLRPNDIQTIRGEVVAVNTGGSRGRFEATIQDSTGKCGLIWFNAAYLGRLIHPGLMIRTKGKVRFFRNFPQMIQPKWEVVDETTERIATGRCRAIYPATERLSSDTIGQIIEANLESALTEVEEWFHADLLTARRLMQRGDAYRAIHLPANEAEAIRARRRLIYDELMLMQLGLGLGKRARQGRLAAPVLRIDRLLDERIRRRFGFELTEAQLRAIYEIVSDLRSGTPMNRLLQGDVGSGKTVVALYAMLTAVANRMQGAILAPTEVLAEQHFVTLKNILRDSSVCIELFTHRTGRGRGAGSVSAEKLRAGLSDGSIHLAVGTQALIAPDIEFANLGLVVVDEQHKLGVKQRALLKSKGLQPHYLVMTATPIPRTLALSYFADFDLSVIDALPPGRQPIVTRWLREREEGKAYDFVRGEVAAGRQAYVVLPHIDEDALAETKSVQKEFERLKAGPLAALRLSMLHGRMNTELKQKVMTAFRAGESDVLVATTVIEVGIDVPNSTVIVIGNADRFGLSQLHQLRGRVGRGVHPSTCLLIADAATGSAAAARLEAMTRTSSGFDIAELDLQLRGPGEFFGTRQHGLPEFKLADITNEMELLAQAKQDAIELLDADPKLADRGNVALRRALVRQLGENIELAGIG